MHAQRRRARDNASVRLDHLASEVERLHDGAKMFRAVREMTRKPASKLKIQDDCGRVICNAAELNERVTHHFGRQFGQDIAAMSETQRKLRLQINNTRNQSAPKQAPKQQRNRIMHAQGRRARDNASVRLDHLASEVEMTRNDEKTSQ